VAGRRIVMATIGSEGDVHPFIGVALALKARGHEAVIATRSAFQAKIEREGLGYRRLRPDTDDAEAIGLTYDEIIAGVTEQATGLRFLIKRIVTPFIRETYLDLAAACEGADLLVSHNLVLAAPLLAEKTGLPWLSAILQPFSFMSAHDPPPLGVSPLLDVVRRGFPPALHRVVYRFAARYSESWFEPVRQFRADLGLSPSPLTPILEGPYSPLGTMALYSKALGAAQRDFPPNTVITGFPFYDSETGGGSPLDPQLTAFLDKGPAPIVFTLGTSAVLNPGSFFRESLDAAARLGRRAVLLVGQDGFKHLPDQLPDTAIACAYAPHSALFPRAEVVVHQGGVGTTGEALRAGRPQLVTPHMADQPDNAARLKRLGVSQSQSPKRYTAASATRAIDALASRPAYANAAKRAAALVAAENGAEAAADVIELAIRR
jgi:UDP:flavonoid glycosyltransferase YjiC (YdhE family)